MSEQRRMCTCRPAPEVGDICHPSPLILCSCWQNEKMCNFRANETMLKWKCLLYLTWDKKAQGFLPALQPKCALHTGFNFLGFQRLIHWERNFHKYKQIVYIESFHLRPNLKHSSFTLQHANSWGGLFQASFCVSCSITYTADCLALFPYLEYQL